MESKSIILQDFHGENYKYVDNMFKEFTGGYSSVPLFAVYERPKDFPCKYVVRLWQINRDIKKTLPTPYCAVKDTLEEARNAMPHNLYRFGRDSSDDPVIIETWI
jgi:hypothetical protein